MTVLPTGPDGWRPARGDYGLEYLVDFIDLIEQTNCVKGCKHAGTPAQITVAMTPSGICPIMAEVIQERPVREIGPRPDWPVCTARQPRDGDQ